jgi:hypothetical protein
LSTGLELVARSTLRKAARWALPFASLLATSCLFDPDQRCGEGQEYDEELDACLCAGGSTPTADGCVPCGRNEVAGAAGCECKAGFERVEERCRRAAPMAEPATPDGGGASEPAPEGEPDAPAPSAGPMGLGEPCTSPADCAGTEAEFCDSFVTMSCLVMGCELGGSDCPPGYGCQDLSMLGAAEPVCAAAICDIAASDCPDGFTCCQPPIPGFPAVCLSGGCGG